MEHIFREPYLPARIRRYNADSVYCNIQYCNLQFYFLLGCVENDDRVTARVPWRFFSSKNGPAGLLPPPNLKSVVYNFLKRLFRLYSMDNIGFAFPDDPVWEAYYASHPIAALTGVNYGYSTAEVAVPGGVWAQPDAPRRSVSMMHDPRHFLQQQKNCNYPMQTTSCVQYINSNYFPVQTATSQQQNSNFYTDSTTCVPNGERRAPDEPFYDLKGRFSPPHIDTPPLAQPQTHRDMSFGGSSLMVNSNNQPQQSSLSPNLLHPNFSQSEKHIDRRKVSVAANFYNYNMPFDERPLSSREPPPQVLNQPQPAWRKHSSHAMQMSTASRKFSQPAEILLSPASIFKNRLAGRQFRKDTMLSSPPQIKKEVSFGETTVEPEPVRKKSSVSEPPLSRKNSASGAPRRHANVPTRKASQMATKSQLRAPRFGEVTTKYTPPPMLSPMRNGTGLFWQACKGLAQSNQPAASVSAEPAEELSHPANDDAEMSDESPGLKIDEAPGPSEMTPPMLSAFAVNTENGPSRKKGFSLMANQMNQPNFVEELEALRKESYASTSSRSGEDAYRKISANFGRKDSNTSNIEMEEEVQDDIIIPTYSDATPHINIGSPYQARVYKWKDRDITATELESIQERDTLLFSWDVMEDIDLKQVEAYELLSCSQAVPKPGRNKELALHILMENRGNIESSVCDLLKLDTLDWDLYPSVQGSNYNDSCLWSPEEISSFQDAIYKSEKDFHQVAQEVMGSKSVKECIEFYYNWKKACPDDYRKLRNLRRKRQLLEINMQNMEEGLAIKKCSIADEPMEAEAEVPNTTSPSSAAPAFQGLQDLVERRPHANSFSGPLASMAASSPLSVDANSAFRSASPKPDLAGLQKNYQPSVPRASINSSSKKGAQPSADGFFHCRLCDKCFEKVKSLNAHMKSHAMKARAEAEAKAQVDAQIAVQGTPSLPTSSAFTNGTINLSTLPATLQGLTQGIAQGMSPNAQLTATSVALTQPRELAPADLTGLQAILGLQSQQALQALPTQIPLLQQHINQATSIIN